MHDRLLRCRQVEEITGISRSSIYRLMPRVESSHSASRSGPPPSGGGKATSRLGWSRGRKRGARLARPIRRRCDLYDRSHGYILLIGFPSRSAGQVVRPKLHQRAAALKQVGPGVGLFR